MMQRPLLLPRVGVGAVNLQEEWRQCCCLAMGLSPDWVLVSGSIQHNDHVEQHDPNQDSLQLSPRLQMINLMPSYKDDKINDHLQATATTANSLMTTTTTDPWLQTANQIAQNIHDMRVWMYRQDYDHRVVAVNDDENEIHHHDDNPITMGITTVISDDEAALIQSTITSFVATTANELESLRQCLAATSLPQQQKQNQRKQQRAAVQYQQHLMGIVQALMMELQHDVAESFKCMQQRRKRPAVQIWQHPLTCINVNLNNSSMKKTRHKKTKRKRSKKEHHHQQDHPTTDTLDQVLGLDDDDDDNNNIGPVPSFTKHRFLPQRPAHRLHHNFILSYYDNQDHTDQRGAVASLLSSPSSSRPQRPSRSRWMDHRRHDTNNRSNDNVDKKPPMDPYYETQAAGSSSLPMNKKRKSIPDDKATILSPGASTTTTTKLRTGGAEAAVMVPHHEEEDDDDRWGTNRGSMMSSEELEAESVLLQAILQQRTTTSELNAVQQMEQRMMEITTLLSQFAAFVTDQQVEVQHIRTATSDAKQNIHDGQEELIQAKERVQSSKHYMATGITIMTMLLLLMHWIRH